MMSKSRNSMSPSGVNNNTSCLATPSLNGAAMHRLNDSSISSLPTPPATTPFYGKVSGKISYHSEEENSRNTSFGTPQVVMTPGGVEMTPGIYTHMYTYMYIYILLNNSL